MNDQPKATGIQKPSFFKRLLSFYPIFSILVLALTLYLFSFTRFSSGADNPIVIFIWIALFILVILSIFNLVISFSKISRVVWWVFNAIILIPIFASICLGMVRL